MFLLFLEHRIFREQIRERIEIVCDADIVHDHIFRQIQVDRSEIQNRSDTGFDHTVRDVLRGFSRNREDADVHAVVRDVVFKTVHPVGSDIRFSGDFFRIHVENRVDQDAVLPVMIVLCQRLAYIPSPDENTVVRGGKSQYLLDRFFKFKNTVSVPLLSVSAERVKILTDLTCRQSHQRCEFFGRDLFDASVFEIL